MIGHIYVPSSDPRSHPNKGPVGPAGMWKLMTGNQKDRFLSNARIVIHGCTGIKNAEKQWQEILKQLPGATVYAHKESAEAGGPLDFYKRTGSDFDFVFYKKSHRRKDRVHGR